VRSEEGNKGMEVRDGGVGSVAEGAGMDIRASNDTALGPSWNFCAKRKQADAMTRAE
jgi:hypothetical protein